MQKQRAQTITVEERYANWQQTLVLDVPREHEESLGEIADRLELRVYDRVASPLDYDNREPNTIHEQLEHRFLGVATLPFAALFGLGKIDGLLPLTKPIFHSDYKCDFSFFTPPPLFESAICSNFERRSMLKLLVTCDPPLQPPPLRFNESLAGDDADADETEGADDEAAIRDDVSRRPLKLEQKTGNFFFLFRHFESLRVGTSVLSLGFRIASIERSSTTQPAV